MTTWREFFDTYRDDRAPAVPQTARPRRPLRERIIEAATLIASMFIAGAVTAIAGGLMILGIAVAAPYVQCSVKHVWSGEASQAWPVWRDGKAVGCEFVPVKRPATRVQYH
jgi:hypothetical protein